MTSAAAVRRAEMQDATAILPLAKRFVERSPYAQYVTYDEEQARSTLLHALDRGVVYVLEVDEPGHDEPGPPPPKRIVGAIMGMLTAGWFTRDLVATELGWWVDEDSRGHGDLLRQQFERWARLQRAPVVAMSDVILDDATPAGELYAKKGYEVVERAWLKRLGA
jgi:hypothetical protein